MKKFLALILIILGAFTFGLRVDASEEGIVGPDVIYKQYDKVLTMSTIKDLYTASEAITVTYDEYTGYGNIPALYDVTLTSGEFTKDIVISVRQTLGEIIAVTLQNSEYTIHVYKNEILSPQDIINVLVRINYITVNSTTHISSLTNTYSENASAPGTYVFEFRLATTSGLEDIYQVNLRVTNTEELTPDILIEPLPKINVFALIFSGDALLAFVLIALMIIVVILYFNHKKKKNKKRGKK